MGYTKLLISTAVLLLLSIAIVLLNIAFGSVNIPFKEIIDILISDSDPDSPKSIIVRESRLPAALIAWIAGAALSVAGLQMQTLFRNPVAGPSILGISSGASLGVAVLFLAGTSFGGATVLSSSATLIAAALGAMLVFLLILGISFRVKDMTILLVIGLMIAGTIGAIISILQSMGSREALQQFVFWTFGSFRNVSLTEVGLILPFVAVGLLIAGSQLKSLNILLLGDTEAKNLGLDLNRAKILNIVGSCLLAGGVTAFCGPIAFIGLAVPHIARMVSGSSNHKIILPLSIVIGACVGGICNLLSSVPWADWSLPLNAVTSLMGAPFVVWILLRIRKIRSYE